MNNGNMYFYVADLYPGYSIPDTSNETVPTPSDQAAIGENHDTATVASTQTVNFSKIVGVIFIMIVLVLFFGVA